MKKIYEKYINGIVTYLGTNSIRIYCKELEEIFYLGEVVFEADEDIDKIKSMNIHINDKIKCGVYKVTPEEVFYEIPKEYDESELYRVDILEKI